MVNTPTKKIELSVTKLEQKEVSSKTIDGLITYTLKAEHKDYGLPKVTLTSEEPWDGYKYGDTIMISVSNTQTSVNQFAEEENQVTGNKVRRQDPLKDDLKARRKVSVKPKA